jgi:hypothetical protein
MVCLAGLRLLQKRLWFLWWSGFFTKLELFWKTFGKTASPVELIL